MERASWPSSRRERKKRKFWCPSAIPAWGCPRRRRTRSSRRSLPPSLTARVWDCRSAARSWNRMTAACGLQRTLRAARVFRVATGWSDMAAVNLIGSYNYALVALSVLIAIFASYAALDLAGRVTAAGGWTRAVWLLGGAGAMGTGIWSMHYIGMLAFILPIPVAYHWPTVLLSLFAAILASVVALGVVSRRKMGWFRALAGSVLMGAGIASMHYIGMVAMRLPAICQFNSFLVVLSVVFAVLISLAALWITFHFRDEKTGIGWEKLTGAVVMGAAIPVMHYTGMAAANFTPSGMPANLSYAVSISMLGAAGIAAVTFMVIGLALLTSWMDRRFAAQTLELQEEKL